MSKPNPSKCSFYNEHHLLRNTSKSNVDKDVYLCACGLEIISYKTKELKND